ncbi:hypothetical protein AALA00_03745 [Lachnospiraceae bacterium 46-15]
MKARKNFRRAGAVLALLMFFCLSMSVLASSDDNSLSALNIHNGTLSRDFEYNILEYDVTVEPGTAELYLEPSTSNPGATIDSITGTVLEGGKATVLITVSSQSGIPVTYTLHVTESGAGGGETQTEAPETEAQEAVTEAPATSAQTELQTEAGTETAAPSNSFQGQITKLKSDSDLMMKIVYGLIILAVILLVFIINLILRNRDLKDDLKDVKNQLAYYTNEFARKEQMMVTDNYYAPTHQGTADAQEAEQTPEYTPAQQNGAVVEETFGTRMGIGGYQGMMPEDVPPNRPITEPEPVDKPASRRSASRPRPESRPEAQPASQPKAEPQPEAVSRPEPPVQTEPVSAPGGLVQPEPTESVSQPASQPLVQPGAESMDIDVTMVEL